MRRCIPLFLLALASAGCQSWIEVKGQVYRPGRLDGLALADGEPVPNLEALGCVPLAGARVSFLDAMPSEQAALSTPVPYPDCLTDSRGYFEVHRLDDGRRDYFASLRVEKPGFVPIARVFWVDARDEAFTWKVLLVPIAAFDTSETLTLQPRQQP